MMKHKIGLKDIGDKVSFGITPIGYGGAFATSEGNSSFLITDGETQKNLLIDCGSLVYKELRERGLTSSIDWVYITHTHEDHIGSLSTLVYENWFIHKKKTNIICHPEVRDNIEVYLVKVCNHDHEQFSLSYYWEEDFEKDFKNFSIESFNTSGLHFSGFPSSGVVVKSTETDFKVVISGDLGVDVVSFLDLDKEVLGRGEMMIFQDAGTYDFSKLKTGAAPHAFYLDCDYPNVFIYHHLDSEVPLMEDNLKEAKSVSNIVKLKFSLWFYDQK